MALPPRIWAHGRKLTRNERRAVAGGYVGSIVAFLGLLFLLDRSVGLIFVGAFATLSVAVGVCVAILWPRTGAEFAEMVAKAAPPPDAAAAPVPAPDVASPSHACPRCRSTLPATAAPGTEDRACPRGCGALLDVSAVEHVLTRAQLELDVVRALAGEVGARKSACPACATLMHETKLRAIPVDLCLSCGSMWLDAHERARLTRDDAFKLS